MKSIRNTWRYIRRSPYQAFAAVSIMALTFTIAGIFVILSIGSSAVLEYFEQKPQIVVFFKDTKTEAEILALQEKLEKMESVASVKYISKAQALEIYQEQFKNDPLLLEMVSADVLPASLEISATKIEFLNQLARLVQDEKDVQEIVFPQDVVNLVTTWTKTIRVFGLGLVIFLGVVSLITVVTIISMKIAVRKTEIEILQLVGASHWYIRLPFIYEGVFYGGLGALLGSLVNIGLLFYATPFLQALLTGMVIFPIPVWFYSVFLLLMVLSGIILGITASTFALFRYLK